MPATLAPFLIFVLLGSATVPAPANGTVIQKIAPYLPPSIPLPLQPGDVMIGWSRTGADGAVVAEGATPSFFDIRYAMLEHLPRGGFHVTVRRGEATLTLPIPAGAWPFMMEVRPVMPPAAVALYERGQARLAEKAVDEAVAHWREAIAALRADPSSEPSAACWVQARIGLALVRARRKEESIAAYREAWDCAAPLGPRVLAILRHEHAYASQANNWLEVSEEGFRAAIDEWRRAAAPLAAADSGRALGWNFYMSGRIEEALTLYKELRGVFEAEAPPGMALARVLSDMAWCVAHQGKGDEAEELLTLAETIGATVGPGSRDHLTTLFRVAGAMCARGDLAGCERLQKRVLEGELLLSPETEGMVWAYGNLCGITAGRGDLDAAEPWCRRSLALAEKLGSKGQVVAQTHLTLGTMALARGKLAEAERELRAVLAQLEIGVTDPAVSIAPHMFLGQLLLDRGDVPGARASFERARAQGEKLKAGAWNGIIPLVHLAEIAIADRDWEKARDLYAQAAPLVEAWGPVGALQARLLHGQGLVARGRGQTGPALDLFARAVEALEAERGSVGGSDEVRSLHASQFFGTYHDYAELLVSEGRHAEAYHVMEKARARSLLTSMAERDLLLEDEIPPELERERRRLGALYRTTHEQRARLDAAKDREKAKTLSLRLAELREEQSALAEKVRAASPRLAEVRYPQPLDAATIASSLDTGTVLLLYSVGKEATLVFAVGEGVPDRVAAARLPIGRTELQQRVQRFRDLALRTVPPPELRTEAGALYDLLVGPVAPLLERADRVLISPDGALHGLPFAVLRKGGVYLAQRRAVSIVPSGTIFAQWARSRRDRWSTSELVAFADPRRPPAGLECLPQSRRELDELARLLPKATTHVGDQATEERAVRLARHARYLHFATHALADERLPLDAGLALHADKNDDGMLRAWEIYERVRLDADLVTLSACRSGTGAARAGEGLLGLTRAFQYAGARSVLASLWDVGDSSSRWFMTRFYGHLVRGASKDQALRRTQLAAIRAGQQPARWAAYQLYGDWK